MVDSSRPRWLIPLVAAAAVLAVAAATVLATELAKGGSPAPVSSNGAAGPAGITPPGPVPPSTSARPSGTTSGPPSGTAPAAGRSNTASVGTLSLTLPAGWHEVDRANLPDRIEACFGPRTSAEGCPLWVIAQREDGYVDVDGYASMLTEREKPQCAAKSATTTTREYRTVKLGERPAEFRSFLRTCTRTYQMEQWTVPTWPPVQVVDTDTQPEQRDAIQQIVGSATSSGADSGIRVTDEGLITSFAPTPDLVLHLKLDRTIRLQGGVNNGQDENTNHTTYDYVVADDADVVDNGFLCADSVPSATRSCPLSTVRTRAAAGKTGIVHLVFDRNGKVTGLYGEYRP
jgi:hypothetical protein